MAYTFPTYGNKAQFAAQASPAVAPPGGAICSCKPGSEQSGRVAGWRSATNTENTEAESTTEDQIVSVVERLAGPRIQLGKGYL